MDLRFYGRNGRVVVPGSPGLVVEAGTTRTVSLDQPGHGRRSAQRPGASQPGPVSAVAARPAQRSTATPTGADWQVPASRAGDRRSSSRAYPRVPAAGHWSSPTPAPSAGDRLGPVLGVDGAFAPAGAEIVELAAGEHRDRRSRWPPDWPAPSAAIELTSDQPVTGAVISASDRRPAPARSRRPVRRRADRPDRRGRRWSDPDKTEARAVLSNGGDERRRPVSFEVLSYDGVKIATTTCCSVPHATATRRLDVGEAPPTWWCRCRRTRPSVGGVTVPR